MQSKKLHVILLQKTHSDTDNEAKWGMWWKGRHTLSHGTNLNAGVALLFFLQIEELVLKKTEEFVKGHLILVKTIIEVTIIYFYKCLGTK